MVMKPKNAYQRLGVSYIRYIAYLLHVSATLVVTLREVSTKQKILRAFLNKCTFFSQSNSASSYYQVLLPTDAQGNCFKRNIKINFKTAPTCFGVITIIRERVI
jgi:hypothetical protein